MTHWFAWKNNPRRAELYGRRCEIIASGRMGTVLVRFAEGNRETVSRRALRRLAPLPRETPPEPQ